MAKNFSADELAVKAFLITMAALVLYVATVFVFIL